MRSLRKEWALGMERGLALFLAMCYNLLSLVSSNKLLPILKDGCEARLE